MIDRRSLLIGALALSGCASNSGGPVNVPPPPSAPAGDIDLTQRPWIFEYGSAAPSFSNGLSFNIPTQGDIHYLLCPVNFNAALKTSLNLSVEIISSPDVAYVASDRTDTPPCNFSVMLQEMGDDLATDGYRWWSRKFPLQPGVQTASIPFTAANWTGIFGEQATQANGFGATLSRLGNVAITFGGNYFAGHGVYLATGSSNFHITRAVIS